MFFYWLYKIKSRQTLEMNTAYNENIRQLNVISHKSQHGAYNKRQKIKKTKLIKRFELKTMNNEYYELIEY